MLQKLKSRKLWLAILGVIGGIATALIGQGGTVGTVAGVVVAGVSAVTYIVTEGKIDEAGVKLAVDAIKQVTELVNETKEDTTK